MLNFSIFFMLGSIYAKSHPLINDYVYLFIPFVIIIRCAFDKDKVYEAEWIQDTMGTQSSDGLTMFSDKHSFFDLYFPILVYYITITFYIYLKKRFNV